MSDFIGIRHKMNQHVLCRMSSGSDTKRSNKFCVGCHRDPIQQSSTSFHLDPTRKEVTSLVSNLDPTRKEVTSLVSNLSMQCVPVSSYTICLLFLEAVCFLYQSFRWLTARMPGGDTTDSASSGLPHLMASIRNSKGSSLGFHQIANGVRQEMSARSSVVFFVCKLNQPNQL